MQITNIELKTPWLEKTNNLLPKAKDLIVIKTIKLSAIILTFGLILVIPFVIDLTKRIFVKPKKQQIQEESSILLSKAKIFLNSYVEGLKNSPFNLFSMPKLILKNINQNLERYSFGLGAITAGAYISILLGFAGKKYFPKDKNAKLSGIALGAYIALLGSFSTYRKY